MLVAGSPLILEGKIPLDISLLDGAALENPVKLLSGSDEGFEFSAGVYWHECCYPLL